MSNAKRENQDAQKDRKDNGFNGDDYMVLAGRWVRR